MTSPAATPEPFGARLGAEFDALLELSPVALAVWLAFVLVAAWTLAAGGPWVVRLLWRVGFDPRRRLGLLTSGLRILGLLIGVAGFLRPLFVRAPTLGLIALVVLAALGGLIAPSQLRNLASGLALATRSRLREGDLIEIEGLEGTVRDIALLRISVRRSIDGGLTHVPAAEFDRKPVTVGSRRAAAPVEARALLGPTIDEQALEGLRRALWLTPYRRAETQPVLDYDPETGRLQVRIDTWAASAPQEVEAHLRAMVEIFQARVRERALAAPRNPAGGDVVSGGVTSGGAAT